MGIKKNSLLENHALVWLSVSQSWRNKTWCKRKHKRKITKYKGHAGGDIREYQNSLHYTHNEAHNICDNICVSEFICPYLRLIWRELDKMTKHFFRISKAKEILIFYTLFLARWCREAGSYFWFFKKHAWVDLKMSLKRQEKQ